MDVRLFGRQFDLRWRDVLVPLVLLFMGLWNLYVDWDSYQEGSPPHLVIDTTTTIVATLALVLRRHAPLAVVFVTGVALVGPDLIVATGPVFWGEWVPFLVASFSLGLARSFRGSGAALAFGLASLVVLSWRYPVEFFNLAAVFAWFGPCVLAVAAGDIIGRQREQSRRLAQQTEELERTREEQAERAVARERTRIARELHDVIAHNVSIMVVQASAAENILDTDAAAARRALEQIQASGREALDEMKLLLGVLRDHGDSGARTPVPTLRRLDALVEPIEQAGLKVQLAANGVDRRLPPSIDVSAYRVIQEALTNALKYAPGAEVRIRVDVGPAAVTIEVRDDGSSRRESDGDGYGLLGLQERVALHGGRLEAGPEAGGGFAVRAELPLTGMVTT